MVVATTSKLEDAIAAARGARRDALVAVREALAAADPGRMVRRSVSLDAGRLQVGDVNLDLARFSRVLVLGGGKASALMAAELESILGDRITAGSVVVPEGQELPQLKRIRFEPSTHPLPTQRGVEATRSMLRSVGDPGPGDLLLCLVSGGGSALMPMPVEGVSPEDLRQVTELLLSSGADIGEFNCVRKHLSQIKGGRLAERFRGATLVSLIVSDVIGNDLGSVSSGPTVPDGTTYEMAREVLERRGVWKRAPESVRGAISSGVEGRTPETPKPGSEVFSRVRNILVGSNDEACTAAGDALRGMGYDARLLSTTVTGEARVFGRRLAKSAASSSVGRPIALVAGGETTVRVRGKGRGGRNQELVLAAAIELDGRRGVTVLSMGTDGIDGMTDAAGAVADSETVKRAKAAGMDPTKFLRDNDSHTFFEKLGDLIVTGSTGTNVNDVMLALIGKR